MALADDGLLSLDDEVKKYLPRFDGDKAAITIRQLLSHTSGLPPSHPVLDNREITLAQAVDRIADVSLVSKPGQECLYGDLAIQVAGRIAEIASGASAESGAAWGELFEKKIVLPLRLEQTSFHGGAPTPNPHLAGGLHSNALDYGRFLQMLLNRGEFNGKKVLSRSAVEETVKDQTRGVPLRFNPFEYFADLHPGWSKVRYGICNWLEVVGDKPQDVLEVSSPGVFGFCPWIDFRRRCTGILAASSSMTKVFPVYFKLKSVLRSALDEK